MDDDKDSRHDGQSDLDVEDENDDKSLVGDAELLGSKLLSDEEEDDEDEGDGVHRGDGLETFPGYSSALSALPPTVTSFEDNQMEVSASPAFHELDKLFRSGQLTGTQVALLKSKYTELHDLVRSNRAKEQTLLQQAKDYTNQLERQRLELDQAENFPENCNTEVSKLRQQLLRCGNELKQTEERCEQLAYNIQCLEEDHRMIEKEYNRMPKQGEIEKKQDDLKQGNTDLRKEINQRKLETKTLKEDLDNNNRQIQLREKEIEGIKGQLQNLKSELVAASAIPNHISKDSDKVLRHKYETDKKVKDVDGEMKQLQTELQNLQSKLTLLEDEKKGLDREARESGLIHADREKNLQILMKDYEYAKNRETDLLVDKTKLDLNLKHLQLEKANIHEIHSRKVREKDHDLRELKKGELKLKIAQDAFTQSKQAFDKVKQQLDSLPVDDSELVKKRAELTKEVSQLRRALEGQSGLTAMEQMKIEQSVAEEERLLYEQSDLRIEVVELTRLAAIKRDESIQKVRDLTRAEQNYREAKDELKAKQVIIEDHKKKDQEMQIKLKEFAKMYDIIKNERNKCVSLIQISTQKAAEMREKIKILDNEMEILRTTVAQKDRQLQKHRLKHTNGIVIRDSLRNEVSKQAHIQSELREKDDQQRIDISKLELLIRQAEQQMVELRKRFEAELKKRDARGVQLLNLEDELCIFYEKLNVQDQMVKNGNLELSGKEEAIRLLKINLTETKRQVELLRRNLKDKRTIEQELVTLQIQLAQCQDRMMELEQEVENPNAQNRARMIEGKDPEPLELQKLIEKLEDRLATKEERSLELQFVSEQIHRLIDRAEGEVRSGKMHTQSIAEKVNRVNAKLKHVTQKQMACVAELAMLQAESFQLQQQTRMRENVLEQCHIRLEKGEAPTTEMEVEWLQMMESERRRYAERESTQVMAEQEAMFSLPDGSITRAEPRTNAYIPDEEHELPIPRPYGKHAPFRPSDPGSTMRHIRKPIPKPIEI